MNTLSEIIVSPIPIPDIHFQQSPVEINQDIIGIHFHHFIQIPDSRIFLAYLCPQHSPVVISINIIAIDPDHFTIIVQYFRIFLHFIPNHRPAHQYTLILGISF